MDTKKKRFHRRSKGGDFRKSKFLGLGGVLETFGFITLKDGNIGFDGYIGIWILRIYWRYIAGYFYMSIDIS